ncbi:MAG: GAF and ANTAR domain-containing protein, partial [Janthinobacterium lividum]
MGLRCSLSLPLTIGDDTFGALNLYGFEEPDAFGPTEQRELELFAAQAAGTLRVAVRQIKDATLLAQMEASLQSRTVIDQALGIIMGQQRCTASTAFELLRQESQNSRRPLRDIAGDLVQRTSGQVPEPGRPFDPS